MNVLKRQRVNFLTFAFYVGHLPADQRLNRSGGSRNFADDPHLTIGVSVWVVRGQHPECLSQQRIACQYRDRLAERLVASRPSAPQIVVVHRRQIVMDQRIGMNHLDCTGCGHQIVGIRAERFTGGQNKRRSESFAACKQAVAHRPVKLLRRSCLGGYKPIEPFVYFRCPARKVVSDRFGCGHSSSGSSNGVGLYAPSLPRRRISTFRSASSRRFWHSRERRTPCSNSSRDRSSGRSPPSSCRTICSSSSSDDSKLFSCIVNHFHIL